MEINERNIVKLIRELDNLKKHGSYPTGFNLFEAAGMVRQEIRHSNFLSFLLDPKKPHGLGDQFIKKLMLRAATINEAKDVAQLSTLLGNFDDLVVAREWNTTQSKLRIDIVAWSHQNQSVFVFENKVDSSAGATQLADYEELVLQQDTFRNYKKTFIYLTKNGEDPDEVSWLQISYENVIEIIEEMANENKSVLGSDLRIAINHYVDLLRRNIVGDESLKAECSRIIEQYRDVLDFIYKNAEQVGTGADFKKASEKFRDSAGELIKELVSKPTQYAFIPVPLYTIIPDCVGTNYWGQTKPIIMWFYLRGDNSLGLILEVGPIPDPNIDRLRLVESLQNIFGRKRVVSDTYSRVWSEYVRLDDEPDVDMILVKMNGLWSKFKETLLPLVIEVVEPFFSKNPADASQSNP